MDEDGCGSSRIQNTCSDVPLNNIAIWSVTDINLGWNGV